MSPKTTGASTVSCICDTANAITDSDAYLSEGGLFVITGATGMDKVASRRHARTTPRMLTRNLGQRLSNELLLQPVWQRLQRGYD